jgi:autoinducer 2-degrading protein
MFVVTVEFAIDPEQREAFLREVAANARASREREPGCRQFDVCLAPGSGSEVFLYEVYADAAAFAAHKATAHFRVFDDVVASWVLRKQVHTYERLDPP